MCKVVAKLLEVLLAQHLLVPPIWAPRHAGEFYNVLLLFAVKSIIIRRLLCPALKGCALRGRIKPARLVHIPQGLIFVIRVPHPVTTRQKWHLVRREIDTARCPKIPAWGSDTRACLLPHFARRGQGGACAAPLRT
jgi:hypothetical protein